MALTKVGPKYQVTIPKAAREALGIKAGDLVEAKVQGRVVLLRPKVVVDKDPELEKQLEASEADVRAGRVPPGWVQRRGPQNLLQQRSDPATLRP